MRTRVRTRTSPEKSSRSQEVDYSPILFGAFIILILYVILWPYLSGIDFDSYVIWLGFVVPIFCVVWWFFLKLWDSFCRKIQISEPKRSSNIWKKGVHLYKKYLKDKNFINHHNYYKSAQNREQYKLYSIKNTMSLFITTALVVIVISSIYWYFATIMDESFWEGFFGCIFMLLIVPFNFYCIHLFNKVYRKKKYISQKPKFYALKLFPKYFVKIKNKIFFY